MSDIFSNEDWNPTSEGESVDDEGYIEGDFIAAIEMPMITKEETLRMDALALAVQSLPIDPFSGHTQARILDAHRFATIKRAQEFYDYITTGE